MKIPRIQTILYANAGFCLFSALVIVLFSGLLARYVINLPSLVFIALAVGLILFALDVFLTARQVAPTRGKVLYIFYADLAWVLLTPVVMVALNDRLTRLGNLVLVDIALIVSAFAALEWLALRKREARH